MRHTRLIGLPLLVLVAALGCENDPTGGEGPGTVTAVLESPVEDDGGALIEFTGAEITAVEAVDGWALVSQREGAVHVAAIAGTPGDIRLVLSLADASTTPAARVLQVVDVGNSPRSTDGYAVRIER